MLSFIPVIAPVFQLRDALGGMVYVSVPGGVPRSPKPAPCIFQLRDALGGMAHFSVPGGISDRRGQRIQATLTTTGCTIPAVATLPPASRPTTQILLPFSHSGQFPLEAICLEAHGVSSFIYDTDYLQVLDLCFADLEVHLLIPHLVFAGLETYICPVGPRLGLMLWCTTLPVVLVARHEGDAQLLTYLGRGFCSACACLVAFSLLQGTPN